MSDIDDIRALVDGHVDFHQNEDGSPAGHCSFCGTTSAAKHAKLCLVPPAQAALERMEKHWEEVVNEALVAHREAGYAAAREQIASRIERGSEAMTAVTGDRIALYRLFLNAAASLVREMKPETEA